MKGNVILAITATLALTLIAGCQGRSGSAAATGFVPTRNIEVVVSSSPGGGSDMFARAIADIMTTKDLVNGRTIVVVNQTDGGGMVANNRVRNARDDHMLLVFNSGTLLATLTNTNMTIEEFTPLGVMGTDSQLLAIGRQSRYRTFVEIVAALKAGNRVVFGGSKGDDTHAHQILMEELVRKDNIDPSLMPYIPFDATSDAITALLGGHLDVAVVKPAASTQFVLAGELTPVMIYGDLRLSAPFDQAPTIVDLGYNKIEFLLWRSMIGPGDMTAEAVKFWSDVLETVYKSDEWQDYLVRNNLTPFFVNAADAVGYMSESQDQLRSFL